MKLKVIANYRALFPHLRGKALTDELIGTILAEEGIEAPTISRTENGKPYVDGKIIHFSVSHTKDVFACLTAPFNVGLDIQKNGPVNIRGVTERYFRQEEVEVINCDAEGAEERFITLWTRKEALVKYLGVNISDVLSHESVIDRTDVRFIDMTLADDTACCICMPGRVKEKEDEIHISYRE